MFFIIKKNIKNVLKKFKEKNFSKLNFFEEK